MRLKNAWVDECVFILRRAILKSPASSMLLFEPLIVNNMQSRSVLKSSTECPGRRYTTPDVTSKIFRGNQNIGGGQKVSVTDEIIGVSQLLGGHVSELPSPKSTPMVGGQVVQLARHGKLN